MGNYKTILTKYIKRDKIAVPKFYKDFKGRFMDIDFKTTGLVLFFGAFTSGFTSGVLFMAEMRNRPDASKRETVDFTIKSSDKNICEKTNRTLLQKKSNER